MSDTCFNPRPALAGRASEDRRGAGACHAVSILARPSRAGRPEKRGNATAGALFQSSPGPRGPGVAHPPDRGTLGEIVSILARPSRAGRHLLGLIVDYVKHMFQSSPGPRGPGVYHQRHQQPFRACFNPRPALAGRASRIGGSAGLTWASFNPRPALAGRASRTTMHGRKWFVLFQSSPGPRGPGVRPGPLHHRDPRRRFNPRPALAGRASTNPRFARGSIPVSILARPSRAGRHRTALPACRLRSFNPRPALAGRASSPTPTRPRMRIVFQSSPGPRGPGVRIM